MIKNFIFILLFLLSFVSAQQYGAILIRDKDGDSLSIENTTWSLPTMSYPHAELHAGRHFFLADTFSLDANDTLDYCIFQTDTTRWAHMLWNVNSTKGLIIHITEAATFSGGTAVTPVNNNRNSSNASILTITSACTETVAGDTIYSKQIGDATNPNSGIPGAESRDTEIIYKQNTKYIVKMKSLANSNVVSIGPEWYEHIDK